MGQRFLEISSDLKRAITEAPVFFVATAPLATDGHVNLSPKGLDTLRVLGPRTIAYLDLTGSGNETATHIKENGRLTLMLCSFSGKPRIIRIYCRGRVVSRQSPEWTEWSTHFPVLSGTRQIVVGDVDFVLTSCGYAVPEMNLVGARDALLRWADSKGEGGLKNYRRDNNTRSIDGIPAPATD
jgi:Pyridoxamine 5'-phosphate oxidase